MLEPDLSMRGRRLLRWAAGIMVVLGVGHLALATVLTHATDAEWVEHGLWAEVPLLGSRDSMDASLNALAFWGGIASFSMPLVMLGLLVWQLASNGIRVHASIGWVLGGWSLLGALILVPSPFILLVLAGALVVRAARTDADDAGTA